MLRGRRRTRARAVLCILLLGVALVCCSCRKRISQQEEIQGSQSQAEPVLAAIRRYYVDRGAYPERLQDLVPEYLAAMPKTVTDLTYEYKRSDLEGGYILCFHLTAKARVICCYVPRFASWDCSYYVE